VSDDVDRANEVAELRLGDALRRQARRAGLAGKTVADSAEVCAACGDDIPALRRRAVPGCQLCVACQARDEKRKRGLM
jgi:phage/conjugal plasmid C-4 type zinc finger TraR family protein